MSKFWQKKYTSKYTGAEIDAAVAKAGTVPAVTEADAGKALVVDEEGKIVAGEAGGGNVVKINLDATIDDSDSSEYVLTATGEFETNIKEQLTNAYSNGSTIVFNITVTQGTEIIPTGSSFVVIPVSLCLQPSYAFFIIDPFGGNSRFVKVYIDNTGYISIEIVIPK